MPEELLVAILAAGASRRLGQPKQLVEMNNKPLLRRQCEVALEAGVGHVVAVLGCQADACGKVIEDLPVDVQVNVAWESGLGSSIACAARQANGGLLLLHCDQYSITAADLRTLQQAWTRDPRKAVRSRSVSYLGPPVIFPGSAVADLRNLSSEDGARSVLKQLGPGGVVDVEIAHAADDLDTPEQLSNLR